MDRLNRIFSIAGLILLTLCFLFPWVHLDPLAVREANLREVIRLISSESLPTSVRQRLETWNFRADMTPEEIWVTLGQGEFAEQFAELQNKEQLYFWNLLAIKTTVSLKVMLFMMLSWYLVTIGLLISRRQSVNLPKHPHSDPVLDWSDWESQKPDSRAYIALFLPVSIVVMLLFFWQLPYLDSLGYSGKWQMSLLDVLSGARVAFAPRVLAPVGLLCFILAGVDDFIGFMQKKSRKMHDEEY
jgi:hypothetical protein